MSQMRKSIGTRPAVAITWPTLLIPPSNKSRNGMIEGLTEGQHAALAEWYLGVQNSVNSQFSEVASQLTSLASRVDALEKK